MNAGSPIRASWTLNFLGDVAYNQNEMHEARLIYEESAALLRELGDQNFLAYALRRLALIDWREQDYAKALLLCKETLLPNR